MLYSTKENDGQMTDTALSLALITPRYPPNASGGGERSAQLLADNLTRSDRVQEVTVFAFDGAGTEEQDDVTVHRLGDVSSTVTELQNLQALQRVRGRVDSYDVIHGCNMELHPAVGYLSTHIDGVSVGTLNSYHFFKSSVTNTTASGLERLYELVGHPTTGRILRHYLRRIDVFLARSRALERVYRENGFEGARIEPVLNMLDPEFSVPDTAPASDDFTVLYVGTLTENKGVSYLIRALDELPDDYYLRIVGKGPEGAALRRLTTELNLSDRVDFLGWVEYDTIGDHYAGADVFVHPGVWPEPFNRTVLEAMQAGLPVVCTEVGGPPEVISEDRLLCEPANPSSLASAIANAREIGDTVGARNKTYVEANHSPESVIPTIVDVYEDVLAEDTAFSR